VEFGKDRAHFDDATESSSDRNTGRG